jgi:MOSC domain-containing protein YiiM
MKKLGTVTTVLTGKAVPFAQGATSAINKLPVKGRQIVSSLGLINDEQGDHRFHGGIEKALHIYPSEHYVQWRNELTTNKALQSLGAFGENISSHGVTENTVCLHDRIRIGSTLLAVSQGRMPCWKLNVRFQQADMAWRLQNTLRTGWYFSVIEAGNNAEGDEILLCERPYPDWTLARIMTIIFEGCLDKQTLQLLLTVPLVDSWKRLVQRRIETNELEDWSFRLYGAN